jgi:hypothetical protein
MSHVSAGSYLVWTLLAFFLFTFLIFHLWSFDRFQSLKWNSGSGAFKRVMTYTYLLTIPLLLCYIIGFTVIKYKEGYIVLEGFGTFPTPYFLWTEAERRSIFPLMLIFSVGWSFEMVTHLEELCFWLFLVNASSIERSWFRSPYFKTWIIGSIVAVLYMPLVTIFTRADPLKNEAYTFLAGSLGSLSLTIWFLPVLWIFPNFLENLRSEGVDMETIVRLTKFSELNNIRVVFRFLFTVPLAILGIDGVRPHIHINENLFATDFLVMIAGFGCVISSAITLVIFFPRSIEGEIASRDAAKERKLSRKGASTGFTGIESQMQLSSRHEHLATDSYLLTSSPIKRDIALSSESGPYQVDIRDLSEEDQDNLPDRVPPLRPNRKRRHDVDLESNLTENNLSRHNIRFGNVNPMVSNYTSPIDIASYSQGNGARLTFARR